MLTLVLAMIFNNAAVAQPVIIRPIEVKPIVLKPEFRHLRYTAIGRTPDNKYSFRLMMRTETVRPQLDASNLQKINLLLADIKVHGDNFNTEYARDVIKGIANIRDMDVDALVQWIMMETAKSANAELKDMMEQMNKNREEKRKQREQMKALEEQRARCMHEICRPGQLKAIMSNIARAKVKMDSLSELGEEQQLRLQMSMDRMQQAEQMLSNILKKMSETAQQIISNIK